VSIKFSFVLFDTDSFASRDVTTILAAPVSGALNVILLTVIVRQAVHQVIDVPRTSINGICESQSVI